ncbi:MAG: 3-isopropylmalate dehydrogenase [Deltaproteobacteria bacterium]|nr:3-isopropylmalate dehydrogenase [Deltaproteobacteria bacterium]
MMQKQIAVLPGDGIGEEVMLQALRVLTEVGYKFGHEFSTTKALIGGAAYDSYGVHFPNKTKEICAKNDAILFGSVGGPNSERHLEKWKSCEVNALLGIRKAFSFAANFRPAKIYPALLNSSPLKNSIIEKGVDVLIVRELLGDLYFGDKWQKGEKPNRQAFDACLYSEAQIATVTHAAFAAARKRRHKLTLVDKANILHTSKLWREVVQELAKEYSDVELDCLFVDNCAMQLVLNPSQFDVIVTGNMFGDIISDLAAVLPGSLGLLCSSSINADGFALYEPPGGSAPDIAGKNLANPIGQILCVAMMLRHSFSLLNEANAIEAAVESTLNAGFRTGDIFTEGMRRVGTAEMGDEILSRI